MPKFASVIDTQKIPVKSLTPETTGTAPSSPVVGQLWTDSSVTPKLVKVWDGSTWTPLNLYAGSTSTSYAAGNDSRITGAEQTANKGATNGYASLDGSTKVPFAQIPTGTSGSTVVVGNDTRVVNAEQTTNKNAANGYAGLDGTTRLVTTQLPVTIPAVGITGATTATRHAGGTATGSPASGTFITGDFIVATNGHIWVCTAGGSPGTWVDVATAGALVTSVAGRAGAVVLTVADVSGAEATANKGIASGYASLDGSIKVPIAQIPTGSTSSTVAIGNDSRLSDPRVPTDASVTGGTAGAGVKIAANTITAANLAAALQDGAAGVSTTRQLGTGSTQAFPGNGRLDQLALPTAAVDYNGQRITGLGAPSAASDAVRLSDLQTAQAGIDSKPSVRVASTANMTVASAVVSGAVVDGVTLATGDRILLKNQTTPAENGVYIVAASGAASRATDTITANSTWFVEEGTAAGDTAWWVTNNGTITTGTTGLVISQFSGGTSYVGTTNRITVTGTAIDISASYVGQTSITTLGTIATGVWNGSAIPVANGGTGSTSASGARTNLGVAQKGYTADLAAITAGATITVTHSLGTQDVVSQVYLKATGEVIWLNLVNATVNTVTVQSDIAWNASDLRIVVLPVV